MQFTCIRSCSGRFLQHNGDLPFRDAKQQDLRCLLNPTPPKPTRSAISSSTERPKHVNDTISVGLPPFAGLNTPVYSLATAGPTGSRATMNLLTYGSPVSIEPRYFALGLLRGTLSWENMLSSGDGVLQVLAKEHSSLFQLLGKETGRHTDKLEELKRRGVPTITFWGTTVLTNAVGLVKLRIDSEVKNAGDHDVVICKVDAWETWRPPSDVLTTGDLRIEGLL